MMPTTFILTNCTNRKRSKAADSLQFRSIRPGAFDVVLRQWQAALESAEPESSARRLYCGRSFAEAVNAERAVCGRLLVISAGLGVVDAEALVPNYSATISRGSEDAIPPRVHGFSAADWWRALTRVSPFSTSVHLARDCNVWVALSSPYLRMLQPTLLGWARTGFEGLRIFGKAAHIGPDLLPYVLPYDERLNDPRGPCGRPWAP